MRNFLPLLLTVLLAGCTGDLVELTPGGPKDMTAPIPTDSGQAGGGEMGPSNVKFNPDIQADLDAKGCTSTACHGTQGNGSVMYVKPMATAQADIDMNYNDVLNEVNKTAADQSPLLTNPSEPLSQSGHTGGQVFTGGTNDPTYIKWLGWINAGAPE